MTLPIAPAESSGARRRTAAARRAEQEAGDEEAGQFAAQTAGNDVTRCGDGDWLLQQIVGLEGAALNEADQHLDFLFCNPESVVTTRTKSIDANAARRMPRKKRFEDAQHYDMRGAAIFFHDGAAHGEAERPARRACKRRTCERGGEYIDDDDQDYADEDETQSVGDRSYYSSCSGVNQHAGGDTILTRSRFLHAYKCDGHLIPEELPSETKTGAPLGRPSAGFGPSGSGGGVAVQGDAKQIETAEILKTWFFEHIENPYPTPDEKKMLRQLTGMTSTQIRNWFTNFRKRHWNPIRAGREPKSYVDFILFKRLSELGVPGLHGGPPSFMQLSSQIQQ